MWLFQISTWALAAGAFWGPQTRTPTSALTYCIPSSQPGLVQGFESGWSRSQGVLWLPSFWLFWVTWVQTSMHIRTLYFPRLKHFLKVQILSWPRRAPASENVTFFIKQHLCYPASTACPWSSVPESAFWGRKSHPGHACFCQRSLLHRTAAWWGRSGPHCMPSALFAINYSPLEKCEQNWWV